jgi:thymidylate synthase
MYSYLDIVDKILTKGTKKENRTGVDTISIFGEEFKHDMSEGFPLITTKKCTLMELWLSLKVS